MPNLSDRAIEKLTEQVVVDVRAMGEPDKMTKENWRDFLQSIIGELQTDLDAVQEDLDR